MAKQGAKIEKVCKCKKVNRYTRAMCEAELTRLDNAHTNKDGFNMGDHSKYRDEVKAHLATLA